MGRRGRKSKAVDLKVLSDPRIDRVNTREPKPVNRAPTKPDYFDDDDVASAMWDRIVRQLEQLGTISESDAQVIELYCLTYARYRAAVDELRNDGSLTIVTDGGNVKANPVAGIVSQTSTQLQSLLSELGLTPSSRSRVRSTVDQPRDALADFLSRKKSQ
jgi:P27 family predicted phage terminase small subunit